MAMDELGEDSEIRPSYDVTQELPSLVGWCLTSVQNYARSCNNVGEYASGGAFLDGWEPL